MRSDEDIIRGLNSLTFESESGGAARVQQALAAHVRHKARRTRLAWLSLAAAALIVTIIPVYRQFRDRQQQAQMAADRLLLERVDARLMRTVPIVLEPLMQSPKQGEPQ